MHTRRLTCAACLLILTVAPVGLAAPPTNVIFCIGDGMGFEHVEAADIYLTNLSGTPTSLSFESFAHQAEMTTHSANSSITDSAAAGTALATGVKVNNGVISVGEPGDGSELYTLLEHFRDRGKRTGLVTTTYMTHATPAAFGAHELSRNNHAAIAGDYLNQTRPNVLLGGGERGMDAASAAAAGYTVVTDAAGMLALNPDAETHVSGQFGSGHLPYEYDGLGALPHLSQMTATALDVVEEDPDGFLLMVEGGRIDHAGHANDIKRVVHETTEFSNAVEEAIDWAAGRSDTLILVTADHETGGLSVDGAVDAEGYPVANWSTGGHTAANVPIYAWGPNAEMVSGVLDNTELFEIATVPEPASAIVLALGGLGVLVRRRGRP